jgi:hypothetical protein
MSGFMLILALVNQGEPMQQTMLDEARSCVAAAESLAARAKCLTSDCGADRRKAVWDAYNWQVRRAEQIIQGLKGATETDLGAYPARNSRIAFIATSRP